MSPAVRPAPDPAAGAPAQRLPDDVVGVLRFLAVLALLAPLFAFTPAGDAYRWLDMPPAAIAISVAAGLLGLAAPSRGWWPAALAGVVCLTAAVVRLLGLALQTGTPLGGNASTMTFLGGLGVAYLVLGLLSRPQPARAGG